MRPIAPRLSSTCITLALAFGLLLVGSPAGAQSVLYDQLGNNASTITNSQNYETANDAYDNEAADDFEVPAGATWVIGTFEVVGQYNDPDDRPSGVNVRIYRDAAGLPGELVEEWLNLQPTGGFGAPNYSNLSIPLPDAPPLTEGRYWISVQVNLVSGQHWYWRNRTTTTLNPAAWRNPGGAWETPCEEWGQRAATCAPGGELATSDPDQVFRLLEDDSSASPACDDGSDNDGDGFVDLEDPGCDSPNDDSEDPFNEPELQTRRHERRISIRFNDGTGARNDGLVIFGRLRQPEGFNECIRQQPVNIQRRESGRWVTKKRTDTNRRGRYAIELQDQVGRYRAVALRTSFTEEADNVRHICVLAMKVKSHRHS